MQFTFTRMVIPLLGITFGFFISCSTLNNNTTSQQQPATNPEELTLPQIEDQLQAIQQRIAQDEGNADLYYQKGFLLSEQAKHTDAAEERNEIYRQMRESLNRADAAFTEAALPSGNQKVDELLKITWSNEHNQGVEIMQSDSTLNSENLAHAANHFQNATVILPDTAISYQMEARAHYQKQDLDQAIATMEKADERIDELPPAMLEQLAFLYLENDQPREAIAIFEQSNFQAENLNVLHGMANAYITADEHEKAVNLLQRLVDEQPNNSTYLQALATEYYHLGNVSLDRLIEGNASNLDIDTILAEADSLYARARELYETTLTNTENSEEITHTVAQFYQNTAARYQKVLAENGGKVSTDLEQKISNNLRASLPLYQKLVEQYPDSSKYWNSLYQLYSYLGMSQEAEEAKSKIN